MIHHPILAKINNATVEELMTNRNKNVLVSQITGVSFANSLAQTNNKSIKYYRKFTLTQKS